MNIEEAINAARQEGWEMGMKEAIEVVDEFVGLEQQKCFAAIQTQDHKIHSAIRSTLNRVTMILENRIIDK